MNESAPERTAWHTIETDTALRQLHSQVAGLSATERADRLKQYGPNQIPAPPPDTILKIFLRQFKSPLIYLLLLATVVLVLVDEHVDAAIIAFVLLFNAVAGTIQAGRAQNTMRALQHISKTMATVRVVGDLKVLEDITIVPGDIILLREGDKVPADARLLESNNLRVNESPLTGESTASSKAVAVIDAPDIPPADQKNMVFKGTLVVGGSAVAVVVETGANTFIGGISKQISEIHTEIPLQASIRRLSHIIIKVVLVIATFIFGLGVLVNQPLETMFSLAIAVVVSAVPEGLPIVLTLLLATGVWRMGKQNVLVKRLQAVEALGEAKVVAVDKTGTITKNELAVTTASTVNDTYMVEASGFAPEGKIYRGEELIHPDSDVELHRLGLLAALCADATVEQDPDTGLWDTHGDPTDGALLVFAGKLGFSQPEVQATYQTLAEIPFDASLKYHALQFQQGDKTTVAVAGASEVILDLATHIYQAGERVLLDNEKRQAILTQIETMAGQALRVIALAERDAVADELKSEHISELTLVGLVGMKDGLRSEVPGAMERTRAAGIRVVMITGDHKDTAQAIAADAGIFKPGDTVLTDQDIEAMSEEELARAVEHTTVFARITPEHKLSIVQAFRARGDIVAMTGDGVNDALSLVAADLGVAMGKRGTEVAKEAADLILLDDNFGSIVAAVEEGRGIYVNLKKVLLFLFSTSLGEILFVVAVIALIFEQPIVAAQLIWINLVTDGVLDVGLAMEPKEKGLLRRNFVKPNQFFFDSWMVQRMLVMSSVMAIGTFLVFWSYYETDFGKAMTMAVTVMVISQWFKVWACRAEYRSVFQTSFWGNKYIVFGTLIVIVLHVVAVYTPFMQDLLQLQPLYAWEWGLALAVGSLTLVADEVRKYIKRNFESHPDLYT